MPDILVIGEDVLCCAIGVQLVEKVLVRKLVQPPVNTKGITNLHKNLPRYTQVAGFRPVLCIADTDGQCGVEVLRRLAPNGTPADFHLRLAIPEIESWLMADRPALAQFFGIPEARIPKNPDEVPDGKLAILGLARRSRQRHIRREVVAADDQNKPGVGYNVHLRDFAVRFWRPLVAVEQSPSLARAVERLRQFVGKP